MCCLFGLIDYSGYFSAKKKQALLSVLSVACEVRGTDATGISYLRNGRLVVYKRPLPAHEMRFKLPLKSRTIMGHTRMTTQGSASKRYNNHPFVSTSTKQPFTLAHNGVLHNDHQLRQQLNLPQTQIETDSYVAVQLIEKQGTLNFDSLKYMAEQVEGSFTFTVMDAMENLYIVKGDNPMCLYQFPKEGFYLYASTQEILDSALESAGLYGLKHHCVPIEDGEILKITPSGSLSRSSFLFTMDRSGYTGGWFYSGWYHPVRMYNSNPSEYRRQMLAFARNMGIPDEELNYLDAQGLSDLDLEMAIYDEDFRMEFLFETGFYDEEGVVPYKYSTDCAR